MTEYVYTKPGADAGRLASEITAQGLPLVDGGGVQGPDANDLVTIRMTRDLSASEKTTLDEVVAAHDGRPRRARLIFDVWHDIGALTGTQKTKIWLDLQSGTPPKWTQDRGPNAADLHIVWLMATQLGLVAADKQSSQQMLMSIYTVDNPTYLVHPPFDDTINVPGDEAY